MFSRGSRSLTPGLCCKSGAARPSCSGAKTHPVCRPSNRALLNHGKGAVMRRWVIGLLLMGVLGGLLPEKAPAIERGLPEYGNGAQNFFAGVVPPPGFYTSYNLVNYQANKFAGLPGILSFHFEAVSNVFSFAYVGDFKILGANYSASVAVPVTYFGSKMKPDAVIHDTKLTNLMRFIRNPPTLGPGGRQLTPVEIAVLREAFQSPQVQNRIAALKRIYGDAVRLGDLVRAFGRQMQRYSNDYQTGLGNSTLTPIALGWHFGEFHLAPSFNVIIPGTYHRDSSASPSQNFFTFMPSLGLSWLPKWGLEANLVLMYDIPTINSSPLFPVQNSYQSGQGLHFDYCLDYALRPDLRLGAAGYYYQQMTPDIADGHNIGNHARVFGIGPAIQYNPTKALTLQVTNQWEMAAMNTTEGYRVWFNVRYGF